VQLDAIIRTDCTSSTLPLFIAVEDPVEPVPLLAEPVADPTPPEPLALEPLEPEPVEPDDPLPVVPVDPVVPADPVLPVDLVEPDEPVDDPVLPDIDDPDPSRPMISTSCPT